MRTDDLYIGVKLLLRAGHFRRHDMRMPLRLTNATLMSDIETEWMLNALLTTSNS